MKTNCSYLKWHCEIDLALPSSLGTIIIDLILNKINFVQIGEVKR